MVLLGGQAGTVDIEVTQPFPRFATSLICGTPSGYARLLQHGAAGAQQRIPVTVFGVDESDWGVERYVAAQISAVQSRNGPSGPICSARLRPQPGIPRRRQRPLRAGHRSNRRSVPGRAHHVSTFLIRSPELNRSPRQGRALHRSPGAELFIGSDGRIGVPVEGVVAVSAGIPARSMCVGTVVSGNA